MRHPSATVKRGRSSRAATADDLRQVRPVNLGLLPQLLGYELRLAQRAVFADFAGTVGNDTSPGLFGVLVIIAANPGLKQTELSGAVGLDRSSMVPVIDKLEARGLVVREASDSDRRSYGLFLTRSGSSLLARLQRRVLKHEAQVTQRLTQRERDLLMSLLKRLHRGES